MSRITKNLAFAASLSGNYLFAKPIVSLLPDRYPKQVMGGEALVLEGFARSGNSFFHQILMYWNPGLSVAHHTHLFCNIAKGLELNIPSIVLMREPAQAVASMVIWDGQLSVRLGLLGWIHFYSQLQRVIDQCLVLRFEDVVEDPAACLAEINRRFALSLNFGSFGQKERADINARLEVLDARTGKSGVNASVPNDIKAGRKRNLLESMEGSVLLERANRLHQQIEQVIPRIST